MSIGERIKERRKELGYSAEDVADKLGKSRATIYRYESDDVENMPISILEPLAKALQTTPSYLMGWISNDDKNKSDSDNSIMHAIKELSEEDKKFIIDFINKINR